MPDRAARRAVGHAARPTRVRGASVAQPRVTTRPRQGSGGSGRLVTPRHGCKQTLRVGLARRGEDLLRTGRIADQSGLRREYL